MKRQGLPLILTILTLCLVSYSTQANLPSDPPQKANLTKGDKAPFTGVLLSRPALAKIITNLKKQNETLRLQLAKEQRDRKIEVASADTQCSIKVQLATKKLTIQAQSCTAQKGIYKQALTKAVEPPPFFKSPVFALFGGILLGGGICAGSVAAANAAQGGN